MVIREAVGEDHVEESVGIYQEVLSTISTEPGIQETKLMIEDGGNLMVFITVWDTRESCLRYHSSKAYRQFMCAFGKPA